MLYLTYPQIVESLSPQFKTTVTSARKSARSAQKPGDPAIRESAALIDWVIAASGLYIGS